MKENRVKRTLREGGVALGTMVFEFNTTGIARLAAEAGADFVVFDTEHTGWSIETIRMLIATSRAADLVPAVRVPATEYHFLARTLDVGAMGLMIPMVECEDQARRIVQFARYPPQGRRGAAFSIAHDDYQDGDVRMKMASANQETLLIAQIETVSGIEHVDQIAAVDGIDVLWLGHYDLTNSMGIPGQFDHPDYQRAVDRLIEAGRRHGKATGYMTSSVEDGQAAIARGFRALAYSGDLWLYKQALRDGITGLRGRGR